jgi:CO/xanthine dehydrogenase FAD-binding subunit
MGPGKTDLEHGEILYGIRIEKRPEYNFQYYEKVGQRNALSIAIAAIAILARISSDNIIEKIAIAWGSVGPAIITCQEIENRLTGRKLSEQLIKSVFPHVENIVSPIDDIRAGRNYRLVVSKNLLLRILGA